MEMSIRSMGRNETLQSNRNLVFFNLKKKWHPAPDEVKYESHSFANCQAKLAIASSAKLGKTVRGFLPSSDILWGK